MNAFYANLLKGSKRAVETLIVGRKTNKVYWLLIGRSLPRFASDATVRKTAPDCSVKMFGEVVGCYFPLFQIGCIIAETDMDNSAPVQRQHI